MLGQSNEDTAKTDTLLDSTLFSFHAWNPLFDNEYIGNGLSLFYFFTKPFL